MCNIIKNSCYTHWLPWNTELYGAWWLQRRPHLPSADCVSTTGSSYKAQTASSCSWAVQCWVITTAMLRNRHATQRGMLQLSKLIFLAAVGLFFDHQQSPVLAESNTTLKIGFLYGGLTTKPTRGPAVSLAMEDFEDNGALLDYEFK